MSERRLRDALLDQRVPDERGAEERALRLVRAAYVSSPPGLKPRRRGRRRALQVAVVLGLVAALISPAGAAVRHWVRDAVEPGHQPSLPALTSLPAPGSLLVDSARGPWVVHADGSKRLLGSYSQSSWSPHGLFVVAAGPDQLAAVEPGGDVRWTISRSGPVRDPVWSPDGYRVAYLSGRSLRVVAGDGTGDRLLATRVGVVGPAWEPGAGHALTFLDASGRVRTTAVDTGRTLSAFPAPAGLRALEWSPDGSRLLLLSSAGLELRDRSGAPVWRRAAPRGMRLGFAAFSPGGQVAAVATAGSGAESELLLLSPGRGQRRLFAGLGRLGEVAFSPDGRWLLLAWRSADQWLFLNPLHPRRVVAISGISAQFDPGTTAAPAFPRLVGWCCPPRR